MQRKIENSYIEEVRKPDQAGQIAGLIDFHQPRLAMASIKIRLEACELRRATETDPTRVGDMAVYGSICSLGAELSSFVQEWCGLREHVPIDGEACLFESRVPRISLSQSAGGEGCLIQPVSIGLPAEYFEYLKCHINGLDFAGFRIDSPRTDGVEIVGRGFSSPKKTGSTWRSTCELSYLALDGSVVIGDSPIDGFTSIPAAARPALETQAIKKLQPAQTQIVQPVPPWEDLPIAHVPGNEGKGSPPNCPRCSGQMVKKWATTGRGAGKQFWSCSRFPQCYGSRSL